jgi:hypothetical protein
MTHAETFAAAVIDMSDELPEGPRSFLVGPHDTAAHLLYRYLMREKDSDARTLLIEKAINLAAGLWLPSYLIEMGGDSKNPDVKLVSTERLPALRQLVARRIEGAAGDGRLDRHPMLGALLIEWVSYGNSDSAEAWVKRFISTSDNAIAFLRGFLVQSTSQGLEDRVAKIHWSITLTAIEKFVTLEEVEAAVSTIDAGRLSADDGRALLAFMESVKKRRDGVSEGSLAWVRDSNNPESI